MLGDAESGRALIGDFRSDSIVYGVSHYLFANRDRTEVMTLVQHPGAFRFEISEVHVRAVAAEESLPFFPGRPQHFVTALGIHIGATKGEVKAVYQFRDGRLVEFEFGFPYP